MHSLDCQKSHLYLSCRVLPVPATCTLCLCSTCASTAAAEATDSKSRHRKSHPSPPLINVSCLQLERADYLRNPSSRPILPGTSSRALGFGREGYPYRFIPHTIDARCDWPILTAPHGDRTARSSPSRSYPLLEPDPTTPDSLGHYAGIRLSPHHHRSWTTVPTPPAGHRRRHCTAHEPCLLSVQVTAGFQSGPNWSLQSLISSVSCRCNS